MVIDGPALATGVIVAAGLAGLLIRPWRASEAVWPGAAAVLLVALRLLTPTSAWHAVLQGADVYLFLVGMMLLAESARREGVFDWAAACAVRSAGGSTARLFVLVYVVGVVVTAFLSNDATAVVLTPAVFAAARQARIDPLPILFACAMVANAASFVLPISNPANLVLYGGHVPALASWLVRLSLPAMVAVVATGVALRWTQRAALTARFDHPGPPIQLGRGGLFVLCSIGGAAVMLLIVSALGVALGLPTALLGCATIAAVAAGRRQSPLPIVRGVSWSVIPLVAGLFVLVAALQHVGVTEALGRLMLHMEQTSVTLASTAVAGGISVATDLMNNLPAGLLASGALAQAHAADRLTDATLIGVDLGPNLSITGSLATILWLIVIRREGAVVSFWQFMRVGLVVMPPALILAVCARLIIG